MKFRSSNLRSKSSGRSRRLRVEPLEQRRLLAVSVGTAAEFQAAIAAANSAAGPTTIEFVDYVDPIQLATPVVYTGGEDLTIEGNGVTIEPAAEAIDLFASTGGADLSLSNLTFQNGDNGVLVPVPSGASGTVAVSLDNVTIKDNEKYGLHLTDQVNDTDASVRLDISNSTFTHNGEGEGVTDLDGVRVDDGGDGGIIANVSNSHFDNNGADGLEVDESGPGGIVLNISDSTFDDNGFQDPDDLEDGIDVDETDEGGVSATIVDSTFNGNADEGIDLDEQAAGDMDVSLLRVEASDNEDEGIKIDEKPLEDENEDPISGTSSGNLSVTLVDVTVNGTKSQEGIALTEQGDGDFTALLKKVVANSNGKEGIQIDEEGAGYLEALLTGVKTNGNADDGTQITEDDEGDLTVVVVDSVFNGNEKYGLKVEQGGDGSGTLTLEDIKSKGNRKGPLGTDGLD